MSTPLINSVPLKRVAPPRYPTHLEVSTDPDLLRRNLPQRWITRPKLATTATLLLSIGFAACERPQESPTEDSSEAQPAAAKHPDCVAVVAPLFKHGEGRGASGCIVVVPPVFLTEDEAWSVIFEECNNRGVHFTKPSFAIPGVRIADYQIVEQVSWDDNEEMTVRRDPPEGVTGPLLLEADWFDRDHSIAAEFVSGENPAPKAIRQDNEGTVGSFSTAAEADSLREEVQGKATHPLYFAAFYDPLAPGVEAFETRWQSSVGRQQIIEEIERTPPAEYQKKAKENSKRLLRLQVQDFIKWLQAQGAI